MAINEVRRCEVCGGPRLACECCTTPARPLSGSEADLSLKEVTMADAPAHYRPKQKLAWLAGWMPFVPDALAVVNGMNASAFDEWQRGLRIERKRGFAGEEWIKRFGALLLPEQLIRASLKAHELSVPMGAVLIRMQEVAP
jgi:hypothetical protein